jgi:hypothetical protein
MTAIHYFGFKITNKYKMAAFLELFSIFWQKKDGNHSRTGFNIPAKYKMKTIQELVSTSCKLHDRKNTGTGFNILAKSKMAMQEKKVPELRVVETIRTRFLLTPYMKARVGPALHSVKVAKILFPLPPPHLLILNALAPTLPSPISWDSLIRRRYSGSQYGYRNLGGF